MPRKKKHDEHVSHERWLVSYADFITLLFAFFVVLFASSQVNHRKISQLAQAIQAAFQQLGIFPTAYTHPPLTPTGSIPVSQMRLVNSHLAPAQMFSAMTTATEAIREQQSLGALRLRLETELAPEIRQHVVAIQQNRDGLIISLREVGFYPSGSATLKPGSLPAVRRIAKLLRHRPENIRFEGHTDNVPIHNAHFSSNWELSVARATGMLRLFITRFGFQPARLSAAGYGQYHPIASNTTAAGRALNRRVDIVVLAPRYPLPMSSATAAGKSVPPRTPALQAASTPVPPESDFAGSAVVTGLPLVVSPGSLPTIAPGPSSKNPPAKNRSAPASLHE